MTTYEDLKNLKSSQPLEITYEKGKERSHVYYDPHDFSYKFVKVRYDHGKRIFNHTEISEFAIEDLLSTSNEIIEAAIEKLQTNECWTIDLISNDNFASNIIDCELCKRAR